MAVPLHERVRSDLERQIASGEFAVGDWLPSEAELRSQYGVSVTPVRHALNELERMGLISRFQGRGSQVRSTQIATHHGMVGFSGELRRRGHDVVAKTISVDMVKAGPEIADALGVKLGSEVILIRRIFIVDDEPFTVFDHYLRPLILISKIRAAGQFQSLYQLMSQEGVVPVEANESITADLLGPEDAKLLGISEPSAVLLRRRIAYAVDRVPVEFTIYRIRPDRYSMDIEFLQGGH